MVSVILFGFCLVYPVCPGAYSSHLHWPASAATLISCAWATYSVLSYLIFCYLLSIYARLTVCYRILKKIFSLIRICSTYRVLSYLILYYLLSTYANSHWRARAQAGFRRSCPCATMTRHARCSRAPPRRCSRVFRCAADRSVRVLLEAPATSNLLLATCY